MSTPSGFPENATLCPPGTFNYSDAGPCPAGAYCPEGTAEPKLCPPGTFSNKSRLAAVEQCLNCTAGQFCGDYNLTSPSGPCREGYYCPSGASRADWIECPIGAYCVKGSYEPTLCPNGTFRNMTVGKSVSDCFNCTPGFYCQGVGLIKESGPCAPRSVPRENRTNSGLTSLPLTSVFRCYYITITVDFEFDNLLSCMTNVERSACVTRIRHFVR